MSNNLLELLKEHLSGDVVSNLAGLIGESSKNIESAVKTALPSVLAGLIDKSGDSQSIGQLFNLLTSGNYDGGVLSNLGALSRGGEETNKLISEGKNLLASLFGNKAAGLTDLISKESGVSSESASSLLGFVMPVVLSFLGRYLKIENIQNAAGLANLLNGQSGFLSSLLPAGFSGLLGGMSLGSALDKFDAGSIKNTVSEAASNVMESFDKATELFDTDKISDAASKAAGSIADTFDKLEDKIEDTAEASLAKVKSIAGDIGDSAGQMGSQVLAEGKDFAQSAANAFEEGAGEGMRFLPWILLAAGALLIWGLLKSCGESTEIEPEKSVPAPAQVAPPPQPAVTAPPAPPPPVEKVAEQVSAFFEKTLPGGYAIKSAKDGFISKLVGFIESSDPVSKDLWFSMDGITFDTNKATIKKESDAQINDIAEILKAYPKVKIKIGGYTDNTGKAKTNLKLSQNRAAAVKKALAAKGIAAGRMDAEGYGSAHPVASNDTEEGRQKNRRIDVRVTEK